MYWYVLVQECGSISRYITVYRGICKYKAVYGGICLSEEGFKPVHTGTYWYISVHTLIAYFVPCCTRLARLKAADWPLPQDTLVHTHTGLFQFCSHCLPSRLRLPVGAGRRWWQWAGQLPRPTLHVPEPLPCYVTLM